MVSEKLKKTLDYIGASNSDIGRYGKLAASTVSRIKVGSRNVKMNSVSIEKIADGIYLYCDDRNIVDRLCSLFNGSSSDSREKVEEQFIIWLFDGVEEQPAKYIRKKAAGPFSNISSKLDRLLTLTEVSNIRLARAINIDSSYISRIRNGIRTPRSNTELVRNISAVLSNRIAEQNKIDDAARLIGVAPELITNDFDLANEIYAWLCDSNQEDILPAAEILLDKIEAFSPDNISPTPVIYGIAEEIKNDTAAVYKGTDGLRRAVTRFLVRASEDGSNELWLYSDQDMDWMVGDDEFRLNWFALMAACVSHGVRVKIIHNIDRGMTEMMAAITNWLPLYMFGTIEPYYCLKRTDDRFSHTLFLCRGKACINTSIVRGTESIGYYNYHTDTGMLDFFEKGYKNLLKVSKPLVKLYGNHTIQTLLAESVAAKNESIAREAFSLATMPKELLLSMLDRVGIAGDEYDRALSRWETEQSFFLATLKNGYFHELIPVIRDEVSDGTILSDIAEGIAYTHEELGRHIENILRLMDIYPGYRIYLLPEEPFTNMRIAVDENRVIVSRMNSPQMSFVFTHPLMLEAFDNYIIRLKSRCGRDKYSVRKALEAYL